MESFCARSVEQFLMGMVVWESSIRALALAGVVAAILWMARVRLGAVQHPA